MTNQNQNQNPQNPAGKPAAQQPRKDSDMNDAAKRDEKSSDKMKDGGCGC